MTMQIAATIFLLMLSAWTTKCDQANGQKAHFQVKNKEVGKLEIHATKKSAKVLILWILTLNEIDLFYFKNCSEKPQILICFAVLLLYFALRYVNFFKDINLM